MMTHPTTSSTPFPIRRLSPQQARIVQLIGDRQNLSYRDIGAAMAPPLTENTVSAYVRQLSLIFDSDTRDAYPPRTQILVWVRWIEFMLGREPTLDEIIAASEERAV